MATVASLVRGSNGHQSFIDYQQTYKDDNKEFLRGDMWEWKFTNAPKIVYYPGDKIINARLVAVNVGTDSSIISFDKRFRNEYVIRQDTGVNTSGTITLSMIDKEDQALSYFFDDWHQKIADRDTKYSFRKDDLVADGQLILTNSSRIAVRTLNFYNLHLQDSPLDENGTTESGTDRADIQVSLFFEHYDRTFNNL